MTKFASDVELKNPTPKETMPELFIRKEFRELLPRKNREEYKALEADILHFGCQQPILVTEDGTILDGHYRYEICKKHNYPFKTQKLDGFDRSEAVLEAVWLDYEKNLDKLEM